MKNPHRQFSQAWHQEEDFNALARLYIRGILTEAEKNRAARRMKKKHDFQRNAKPKEPNHD